MLLAYITHNIDFSAIKTLLRLAISQGDKYRDTYIKIIVSDAKKLKEDSNNIRTINRDMFDYSVYLQKNGENILDQIDSEHLDTASLKKILTVFEQ